MNHFIIILLILIGPLVCQEAEAARPLFGYQETARSNMELFPQWRSVLERHIKDMMEKNKCRQKGDSHCRLASWLRFLDKIKNLSEKEKIEKVNTYVNQHKYILDVENYGIEDYWATPREFLHLNGDCEDYAITKMLSLERIGVDINKMRVVVVQDTNLRIPHAVMSIEQGDDLLILDNQIKEVISHDYIFHYIPVYSINDKSWWMHVPN